MITELKPDLTGFEIVVASSNTAFQNVTDEIPSVDAIDESWHQQARTVDYFHLSATALLTTVDDRSARPSPAQQAWALVAARLGNEDNRSRFVSSFWYHKPSAKDPAGQQAWYGMMALLETYH